ncbi:MAG: polyprenyl synthetase family protein [Bacteroidota bacterium]
MHNYLSFSNGFNAYLSEYTTQLSNLSPKELYEPESYILNLSGKRVRPILALVACDLFEKDFKLALNAAAAVELFHNFSLIHDDILDAAPLRRSQPTVHMKWNTNIAILSGDVMLVKAFKQLERYPAEQFKQLCTIFSKTSIEVCEGQQNDMNFESRVDVSVDEYIEMITKKTAVLLGCSLQMGAICAGAGETDQNHLYEFGKHIGIAFQLLDDYLDAFAPDADKFGKQVGGDIIANKKTYLLLKTMQLANSAQKTELERLLLESDATLKVNGMLNLFNHLNVKSMCLEEADKHTKTAISELEKLTVNTVKKKDLEIFALNLLQRSI